MRERLLLRQAEDPWPEDPWEVRERLLVYQPEVRERLFRCFRGVSEIARKRSSAYAPRMSNVAFGTRKISLWLDAASQTYFTGSESNVRDSGA